MNKLFTILFSLLKFPLLPTAGTVGKIKGIVNFSADEYTFYDALFVESGYTF